MPLSSPSSRNRASGPGPDDAGAACGLAAVFVQNRGPLHRFLLARSQNPADADDLLQELWIRISALGDAIGGETSGAGVGPLGPIANPRAYLFRMANNLALDAMRSHQRTMARDRGWLDILGRAEGLPDQLADPAISADDALAQSQEYAILAEAIEALPPGARRALRLHRLEGLKQDEVARIMGISRSGVEKHLALALKHLRAGLKDSGLLTGVEPRP